MVLLESTAAELGKEMPDFELVGGKGVVYSRDDVMGANGLLLIFSCNHCPYAIAVWPRLVELARYADGLGIGTVAINPNINPNYPEDAPDKMPAFAEKMGITFPYLADVDQSVARAYDAQCTPDMYLLNAMGELVYRGRIDDNWKDETQVSRQDLREALSGLSSGKPPLFPQYPSMGCSIKWQ